jgi:SAM-dependent methyltransferase
MASSPLVFDRRLLRARRRRARAAPATFLIERVAEDLVDRLSAVLRRFDRALDIGTPTADLRRRLMASGRIEVITAADTSFGDQPPPAAAAPSPRELLVAADEETLPFCPNAFDLVVSALSLQLVNDLPGTLVQIRRVLRPDGLLLAALVGGETLRELRQAMAAAELEIDHGISPRVAPFIDVRDAGALLQRAGFALPVADIERVTVRYPTPLSLLIDLRRMGATSALLERRRRPLRRAVLARMMQLYAERFADPDGRIPATFDIVWMSGWAPHDSQQKPLAPGSARMRLAQALGTTERPAGERAGPGE